MHPCPKASKVKSAQAVELGGHGAAAGETGSGKAWRVQEEGGMTPDIAGWQEVEAEIARIVQHQSDSDPFSPETVRQAEDIVSALSSDWPHPSVGRGYWKTIIFNWGKTVQLEIFSDRVEVYRFGDTGMEVRSFAHKVGEPLSQEFLSAICSVKISN